MSSAIPPAHRHEDHHDHDDIVYPQVIPFLLVHAACFVAIWTGVTWEAVIIGIALYWLRMFGITAGYHRYFSHRSYATSRVFQFMLACLAQSTAQKSVLWWAAKHRHHHLFSDTEHDVHSPRHTGFLFAHVGWIFARKHDTVDLVKVGDLAKYPELMWLHKYELAPAAALALITFLIAGWPGLVVGFFWSTVAVYHATFCINSLAHVHGSKRYVTGDDSRNNWLLAFFTMGEGWHNNHHAYQASVRQGFRWWEIDPTFYIIKALSWLGVVWDLKSPPEAVLAERAEARLAGDRPRREGCRRHVQRRGDLVPAEPGAGDHAGSCRPSSEDRGCAAQGPRGAGPCASAAPSDPGGDRRAGLGHVRQDAVPWTRSSSGPTA